MTNKWDANGVSNFRYQYDANGRLTSRWSSAKGTTSYQYDEVGNLTFINYPSSVDITFQYDALNRLTNQVDAAGTNRYTYTASSQLATVGGVFASDYVANFYHSNIPGLSKTMAIT